jgi:uncharacterized delta-60 repeat protein
MVIAQPPTAGAGSRAGTLDSTFGNGGTVRSSFGGESDAGDMAMRGGRIVLAGTLNGFSEPDIGVAVFTSKGDLDRSFSRDGRAVVAFDRSSQHDDRGLGAAISSKGKIVVVGKSGGDAVALRWTAAGKLDRGFGVNGRVRLDLGGAEELRAAQVRGDGSIVAVGAGGAAGNSPLVVQLRPNGSLDPAFGGGDGWVLGNAGNAAVLRGLVLSGGTITAVGRVQATIGSDALLMRWSSTGTPDPSFSGNGLLVDDLGGDFDDLFDVVVDDQGRIVTAGRADDLAVARYLSGGDRDTAFGDGDGLTVVAAGASSSRASGIALQPDGRIVVAGEALEGFDLQDQLVVRFRVGGSPDLSFSGDGLKRTSFTTSGDDAAVGLRITSKGRVVTGGVAGSGLTLAAYRG